MKRIIALYLALLPLIASAQSFQIDNEQKKVTWSKVYQTDLCPEEIHEQILAYGLLDDVVSQNNMIAGNIPPTKIKYESLGYTRMRLPIAFDDYFTGRIIFRFKEGRYHVEVVNMRFIGDVSTRLGGCDLYALFQGDFKATSRIVDNFLVSLSSFSRIEPEF